MASKHLETPQCGFDRDASHAAGRYVCACGYEAPEQPAVVYGPANQAIDGTICRAGISTGSLLPEQPVGTFQDRVWEVPSRALNKPDGEQINAGARGSKERVGNVQPSHVAPAPNDLAAANRRITELEAQLAEAKSIALDAQSESAAYQAMQERAQGDNATLQEQIFPLREDSERYRWFRSKRLWDADQFPWPKDFEYPEPCLWDEGEMLDAAIDAVRKA